MDDGPLSVLVVDGEQHVRELLRSFLEDRGMQVFAAESAEEALALPELERAGVALLDTQLSRRDNNALLWELRRRLPHAGVILMAGAADLDDVIAEFGEQVFAFVRKPFPSLKEIAVLIERAAQSKALERQNREYAQTIERSSPEVPVETPEGPAEPTRFQQILAHFFCASSEIGRLEPAERLLDFVCQVIVQAGAFRRAVILLADERFRVSHAGIWDDGGDDGAHRERLSGLIGQPLRPYEFDSSEERIAGAVYRPLRPVPAERAPGVWRPGDRLFLPLFRQNGGVFGYLSVDAPANDARPAAELIELLEVLLGHGTLHLETHELRDRLQRRNAELEAESRTLARQMRGVEERLDALVRSTTDIVFTTDERERFTFLSDSFTRLLGYARENYLGRPLYGTLEDLMTENPANQHALQELAESAAEHVVQAVELLTRQGDKRTLEVHRARLSGGGIQGLMRDATEHRLLLQQLAAAERLAVAGRLAAGVAHEISNPLQAMLSQVRAVQRKLEDRSDPTENLRLIEEGIERLRQIVRGMLDLNRAQTTHDQPVDLNDVAEKVAALTRQQLAERGVQIVLNLDRGLQAIPGSAPELEQVALNLVLNAMDAMPGGGEISITTRSTPQTVELSVRDTGVGIAAEHLPQIFEPFFTSRATGQGTGLGLYLSRSIVERHRGQISVQSERGHGATFTLSFPRL